MHDAWVEVAERYAYWHGARGRLEPRMLASVDPGTAILMYHAVGCPNERASRFSRTCTTIRAPAPVAAPESTPGDRPHGPRSVPAGPQAPARRRGRDHLRRRVCRQRRARSTAPSAIRRSRDALRGLGPRRRRRGLGRRRGPGVEAACQLVRSRGVGPDRVRDRRPLPHASSPARAGRAGAADRGGGLPRRAGEPARARRTSFCYPYGRGAAEWSSRRAGRLRLCMRYRAWLELPRYSDPRAPARSGRRRRLDVPVRPGRHFGDPDLVAPAAQVPVQATQARRAHAGRPTRGDLASCRSRRHLDPRPLRRAPTLPRVAARRGGCARTRSIVADQSDGPARRRVVERAARSRGYRFDTCACGRAVSGWRRTTLWPPRPQRSSPFSTTTASPTRAGSRRSPVPSRTITNSRS